MSNFDKVLKIINDNSPDKNIPTLELDSELKVDSITFIKIVVSLEGTLDFEFDDSKLLITEFPTVRSMVEYVESKI